MSVTRTEKEWVAAAKAGDRAAFAALLRPQLPRIHALLLRMTGDVHAAEDLAQEAALRAFQGITQFQGEATFFTWLYRIAVNLCLRYIEREKLLTFEQWPAIPDGPNELSSTVASAEERVLIGQVREGCLTGLVRCLPRDQRLTFVLVVLVGLSIADVASVLACSEDAVKTRVSRARRMLADFVDRRCEWIDPRNLCRCNRFVQYSIDRGLIAGLGDGSPGEVDLHGVEEDIDRLRRVARLYETLPFPVEPKTLADRIRDGLEGGEWSLLT